MTRRIAAAILLTVWATLIAGGFTAYWVTRSVLLADLDQLLVKRARMLPQVAVGAAPPREAHRSRSRSRAERPISSARRSV